MRDFDDSTLWDVSGFERAQRDSGESAFARIGTATVLSTTLLSDLRRMHVETQGGDVLEVIAACLRHREPALLYLQHERLVWPVTLFPLQMLYHSPRDMAEATAAGLSMLKLLGTEPPGVRPPGHWMYERVADAGNYHTLSPMLWQLALNGPRHALLSDIGGTAAYRLVSTRVRDLPAASGALAPAIARLQRESVSLRDVARWPGMSLERAARLLNALYLAGGLIVTRSHPAARNEPGKGRSLFGLRRARR